MTPEKENAMTLSAMLGIAEEEATGLLDVTVIVTPDPGCIPSLFLAERLVEILSRTVKIVTQQYSMGLNPAVEVVIGNAAPRTTLPMVHASITDSEMTLSYFPLQSKQNANVHSIFLVLSACHISAMVMNIVVGDYLPSKNRSSIVLNYRKMYGEDLKLFYTSAIIGEAFLAGAGAIGNALFYSLRCFDVEGKINVVDPDKVSLGNLNRCLFFSVDDILLKKAEVLVQKAQPYFSKLELIPYPTTLMNVPQRFAGYWLRRLIVAVDSRIARRSLQSEFPGEVFDASTTDIREVVLHCHSQPTKRACLSCIYFKNEGEQSHELHIAELLGVSVEEVKKGFISESAALQISSGYPQLSANDLVNEAYDSLYKQLCGSKKLHTAADKQVLAPFAFVSVLAGAYLAIEIVRRVQKTNVDSIFNYWRVSPWNSPNLSLQKEHMKRADCEFCGDSKMINIAELFWK